MPIYTYRCENCGVQFERQQKFSEPPLTWCPECNKKTLRKVYTPVGIVFKGSGFYSTDHRSPSGQANWAAGSKAEESEKTDKSDKAEKTEKKSEPKSSEKKAEE